MIAKQVRGWRGQSALAVDRQTGQTYVAETIMPPWYDKPVTRVYPTDARGSPESVPGYGTDRRYFTAGGQMTQAAALVDLLTRLKTGHPLSPTESVALDDWLWEQDFQAFSRTLNPTQQGGTPE